MPARVHVDLGYLDNPVIVVAAPTGIVYRNQVDGVACLQRALEGFILPLPRVESRVFDPAWWYRTFNGRRPGDGAVWECFCDEIEGALREATTRGGGPVREIRVVGRGDEACEAWVPVSFVFVDAGADGLGVSGEPREGILTWQNCD